MRFVHLHTHSHYSLLEAIPKIPDLVKQVKNLGMDAVALTDHGALYGTIEFYKEAKKAEIKPIIGMEAYIAPNSHKDKRARIDDRPSHVTLLAENITGYKNLMKLSSIGFIDGFYYKPRIDKALLREFHEGIIALSGCLKGEIPHALAMHDEPKAESLVHEYQEIFGRDNFYLELVHHPEVPAQMAVNAGLIELAKKIDAPLVVTRDAHYIKPDDQEIHTILLAIQFGKTVDELRGDEILMDLTPPDEIEAAFRDVPEALANTVAIADRCNVELDLGKWNFPNYEIPGGKSADEYLREISNQGLREKISEVTPEIQARLDYELDIITKRGFSPYFLVVSDYVRWARENGIIATTRGSAAGSLVSYATGIVTVNPLSFKLPFERFLNPFRPSPPDIDMDFADNRRDDVIAYVTEKYGKDKVAQICTFGAMMARGSVRDVGRALGFPYSFCDKVAKIIPFGTQGFAMTIARAKEETPELKTLYSQDPQVKKLLDLAERIEGNARHISVHAAGVVICPHPLTDFTPLQKESGGERIITQYEMNSVEASGVLKMDFLGIRNLSILGRAVEIVRKTKGVEVDLHNLPWDDKKTFELLARGDTIGLFQLNGAGMTRYLVDLKPSNLFDIMAMVALFRPGPMESIPEFIRRKHNPSLITYLDPRMKEILSMSYGVVTYQDDVLLLAIELAGYTWEEADKLRKAMGKKILEEMAKQKDKFIKGCQEYGHLKEKTAYEIWRLIEPFAAYGFNKCLSGDALLTDSETGKLVALGDLYKTNKRISLLYLDNNFELYTSKIRGVTSNGVKKVFELHTRTGRKIKATTNHPFLTFDGWKELSVLEVNDKIAVVNDDKTGVLWDEIKEIKYVGEEETFDVLMPEPHNFVADDVVVHNSHAASYAVVAYQTAYMKANFSAEFMTAVLTAESGDLDTVAEVVEASRKMGIEVLPPDVAESRVNFTYIDDKHIRFGLLAIKNLGEDVARSIIDEREARGSFSSLSDFIRRVSYESFNKKSLEALIRSGALDRFGERRMLMENIDTLLAYRRDAQREIENGQNSLFGGVMGSVSINLRQATPASQEDLLAWEKELLGLYISAHPFSFFAKALDGKIKKIRSLCEEKIEGRVRVAGMIASIKEITTKKGEPMIFVRLEDATGSVEVVVFPRVFKETRQYWQSDTCVIVSGNLGIKDTSIKILCDSVWPLTKSNLEMTCKTLGLGN